MKLDKKDLVKSGVNAIESGNIAELEKLLKKGLDPEDLQIIMAVNRSADKKIQYLLDYYRELNDFGDDIKEAAIAAIEESIEKLRGVLKKEPQLTEEQLSRLFQHCVRFNRLPVLKFLVENYPNLPDYINNENREKEYHPIRAAVQHNNIELLKYLVGMFSDYHSHIKNAGWLAAHYNAEKSIRFLLELPECSDSDKTEMYFSAAEEGNIEIIKILLDNGVSPNVTLDGRGVLHYMMKRHSELRNGEPEKTFKVIDFLLELGIDPLARDRENMTATQIAFQNDCPKSGHFLKSKENISAEDHLSELKRLKVPEDLLAYLREGKNLEKINLSPQSELGWLKLSSVAELHATTVIVCPDQYDSNYDDGPRDPNTDTSGKYTITVVDILNDCPDYDSRGVLFWMPELEMFGTADVCHGVVYLFKNKSWMDIVSNIEIYVNYQWDPVLDDNIVGIYDVCHPWERWEFKEY